MPTGGFGPRGQAITALCPGASHLAKRTAQRVLPELCGVPLGVGPSAPLEQATVQAVAAPVAEARADVQQPPAAYLDETGWRAGQQRAWLWGAGTPWVPVFVIRGSRRRKVAQALLGARFWGGWCRSAGAPPPGPPRGGGRWAGHSCCGPSKR